MALLILKNTPAGQVATLASPEEIAAGVKNKTLELASDGLCYYEVKAPVKQAGKEQDYETKEMRPRRGRPPKAQTEE
jgi:hypothetical protein